MTPSEALRARTRRELIDVAVATGFRLEPLALPRGCRGARLDRAWAQQWALLLAVFDSCRAVGQSAGRLDEARAYLESLDRPTFLDRLVRFITSALGRRAEWYPAVALVDLSGVALARARDHVAAAHHRLRDTEVTAIVIPVDEADALEAAFGFSIRFGLSSGVLLHDLPAAA